MYLKISKFQFFLIVVLILLLPISIKYKLLLFGTRTYGEAVSYGGVFSNSARSSEYSYTVISFKAGDAVIEMKGPEDVIYDIGEKIKIIYNKNNPEKCLIPSLVYFYTMPNVLLPTVLLLVWIAFYTSFKPPKSK